jgi:hypothetical protein
MSRIQPRTLNNRELIRLAANAIELGEDLPLEWQKELLRRFMALAPLNEFPPKDDRQLDLFLNQ